LWKHLVLYEHWARSRALAGAFSLPTLIGCSLTQPLTYRTTEALCWWLRASRNACRRCSTAVQWPQSAHAPRREQERWAQVSSTFSLTCGLLEAGAMKRRWYSNNAPSRLAEDLSLERTTLHRMLYALGRGYSRAQWEGARAALEERKTWQSGRLAHFTCRLDATWHEMTMAGTVGTSHRYALTAIVDVRALMRD